MIGIATLVALLAALAVGVVLAVRRPTRASRVLRCAALALTVLVAAVLTPLTVSDSGAAAVYLLGVPVAASALPTLADLVGRAVIAVEAVGAAVTAAWALLLSLGIGAVFLPSAFLLFAALARDLVPRPSRAP